MRVAFILALVVAYASAEPCTSNFFVCTFKDLGNQLKDTFVGLGGALKDVGSNILSQAADKAKQFTQLGLAAFSKTLTNAVSDIPLPSIGRRGLKEVAHKANDFIDEVMGKLRAGYYKTIDGLMDAAHRLGSLQLGGSDITKDIQDIVDEFESLAKEIDIPVVRRSTFDDFTNQLSSWKSSIGDFLKPHVDNVVNGVKSLGNTLKGHASNLLDTLKGHAATLGDKLKEHVGTLQGHAQTALEQLQSAVSDILKQTVPNVTGALTNAASDVTGTVGDAVSDLSSQAAAAVSGSN